MADLDELALALPQATKELSDDGRPAYKMHGKLFCCQRGRRADALDEHGERLDDVLMFRVADLDVKELLLSDTRGIYFTTPHFNGYAAVLVRIPSLARLDRDELHDLVAEAWLTRAQKRVAKVHNNQPSTRNARSICDTAASTSLRFPVSAAFKSSLAAKSQCGRPWRHDRSSLTKRAASSNVASSAPGPPVGTITRVRGSLKFGACAIPALWSTCADDLKHFPRGLGSASEAYCPHGLVRAGPCLSFKTRPSSD